MGPSAAYTSSVSRDVTRNSEPNAHDLPQIAGAGHERQQPGKTCDGRRCSGSSRARSPRVADGTGTKLRRSSRCMAHLLSETSRVGRRQRPRTCDAGGSGRALRRWRQPVRPRPSRSAQDGTAMRVSILDDYHVTLRTLACQQGGVLRTLRRPLAAHATGGGHARDRHGGGSRTHEAHIGAGEHQRCAIDGTRCTHRGTAGGATGITAVDV